MHQLEEWIGTGCMQLLGHRAWRSFVRLVSVTPISMAIPLPHWSMANGKIPVMMSRLKSQTHSRKGHNTTQRNATQHNTTQHNALQHNTTQQRNPTSGHLMPKIRFNVLAM